MHKKFIGGLASGLLSLALFMPMVASAHVVVKPDQVGIGAFQTFTVGVPNEKDQPVTGLRLIIPEGLAHVSPNVKPGWTIATTKSGEAEDAAVTEINWTGSAIPAGQRDDFLFSAQVPAKAGDLQWKAYQTYQDGTVVAWDQKPSTTEEDNDAAATGPYSVTSVVNDLEATPTPATSQTDAVDQLEAWAGPAAFILSLFALYFSLRKPQV